MFAFNKETTYEKTSMQYHFEHIKPTDSDWLEIETSPDSTCYQTKKWSNYLNRIGYKPWIAKVYKGDKSIGYFIGERFRKFGIPFVTAPFNGIGTYTQGFALKEKISKSERVQLYKNLSNWILSNGFAWYVQIDDWQLREDFKEWQSDWHPTYIENEEINYRYRPTLYVDLKKPETELWTGLHYKSCKYCINKANKLGLVVKEINKKEDIAAFVKEHYSQVEEIVKGHGATPKAAQKPNRMLALCEELFPDRIMMIEVLGKDDTSTQQIMSTGIFCIDKGECSYWTGASRKKFQKYCPNELMVWEAMKRMAQRGAGELNFCGMADYKLKFGTIYAYVPELIFFKYKILDTLKEKAKNWYLKLKGDR